MNLGERTKLCWYAASTQPAEVKTAVDNENCLIKALGEGAYKEINQGMRKPIYDEQIRFQKCYGEVRESAQILYYKSDEKLPTETTTCLKSTLGSLYQRVKESRAEVPYDSREKVNKCFGLPSQPFLEGVVYKIPDETKACLKESVGDERFNQISSGSQAAQDERQKGEACFAKLNRDQVKFLPPPAERVPYIEERPEVVKMAQVEQEAQTGDDKTLGGKVVMRGQGPKDSVVTIYIFSEPIVVTTKTDANGDWVYELNQPLSGEKHLAYAVVNDESNRTVRSSVFDFTVIAAEEDLKNTLLSEGEQAGQNTGNYIKIALILTGVGLVVVLAFFAYKRVRKIKTTNKEVDENK